MEGYLTDSQGRLVPVESVKEIDRLRDQVVQELVDKGLAVQAKLSEFKRIAMEEVKAFVELSLEKYGVKYGGKKGNILLTSFDGRYQVQLSMHDYLSFDERLQAAKVLVDECLMDWTKDSGPEIRTIISDAFSVDKTGRINTKRVLSLRKLEINDPKWKQAMDAISESVQVMCSQEYIRLYAKTITGEYQLVSLDLASA